MPSIADQIAAGWYRNLYDNRFTLNVETYYKQTQNEVDYRNSADFMYSKEIEGELLYGKGRAYGLEIQLKKNKGDFTGWASYTLSKTERKINGINYNEWYNARQDRTHDLTLVGMYDINPKLTVSGTFVIHTGNAVSFPTGYYYIGNQGPYTSYSGRNQERMPLYHRLDLGITWKKKSTEKYESSFNFSLYNAYGHQNAFIILFENNYNYNGELTKTVAKKISLFRFVPSVTWNFKIK